MVEAQSADLQAELREAIAVGTWIWPRRELAFITDLHADAAGFEASLIEGGLARRDHEGALQPTRRGLTTRLIIGGDCFDKGPSNLDLIDALTDWRAKAGDMVIIAGNHDVRTELGIRHAGTREMENSHWWVRMGTKALPLLREILERHGSEGIEVAASNEAALQELLPHDDWWAHFPRRVAGLINQAAIDKELRRIRNKIDELLTAAAKMGMSPITLHTATMQAKRQLIEQGGQYSWLFADMKLLHREQSLLFVHAGVCDESAADLGSAQACEVLTERFHHQRVHAPFELYFGSLGNFFRTKYRHTDQSFTAAGGDALMKLGIRAVVHGHVNHHDGQQLSVRHGLVHVECDTSIDRNTRSKEAIPGAALGHGVTCFRRRGQVFAASSDHAGLRCLDIGRHSSWMTIV